MKKNVICFAKINDKAIIPSKRKEDVGYDLYACFDEDYLLIKPNEFTPVPTGLAWACDKKYYMQIEERSSTGSKGIKKNAGVIDSGYRGEIKVCIYNTRKENLVLSNLDEETLKTKYPVLTKEKYLFYSTEKAIAQGIIHKVTHFKVKELSYEDLCKISSSRGQNGFGSTNKTK